jgi:hypothetical protein
LPLELNLLPLRSCGHVFGHNAGRRDMGAALIE